MKVSKLFTIYQQDDGRIEIQSNHGEFSISKDKKTIFTGRKLKEEVEE